MRLIRVIQEPGTPLFLSIVICTHDKAQPGRLFVFMFVLLPPAAIRRRLFLSKPYSAVRKTFTLSLLLLCLSFGAWAQTYTVTIETTEGDIVLSLYDGTPKHRDNMVKLCREKFFDSTLFHRVIPNFVIQGGDPNSKRAAAGVQLGDGDVGYRVPAEIMPDKYSHKRGAVGAARDQNPDKSSSGCQFYIVTGKKYTDAELVSAAARANTTFTEAQKAVYKAEGGTAFLDNGYTVFGEVIKGMDVADKIAAAARNGADRPNKDIRMLKVRVKKKKRFLLF